MTMATIAELETALLRDYAERGVQRQNIGRAEKVFVWLKRTFKGGTLAGLDDNGIIDRFERSLVKRGLAAGSRVTWQKALRTIRSFGADHGFLSHHPPPIRDTSHPKWIKEHGGPKIGEPITEKERSLLRRRLRESSKSFTGGRDYLIAELAFCHGIKPMQSLALVPADVGDGRRSVTLQGRDGSRPKKRRLSPHIQEFLKEWLEQPRVKEEAVLFPGIKRGRWSYHSWYADRPSVRLKAHCRSVGIRGITFNLILHDHAENHRTDFPGPELEQTSPGTPAPPPSIAIIESKTLSLRGSPICELTGKQREALELLIKKHPTRVRIDELGRSARERLSDLRNRYPILRAEISFPTKDGWESEGYGIGSY
jgi:hypothetical protein